MADLLPHQQRVVDEKSQNDERLGKLNTFIDGPRFGLVVRAEQKRMLRQARLMAALSAVLAERIDAFMEG